jgi:hypothetical protein
MSTNRNVSGRPLGSLAGFTLVWAGQLVSVLASNTQSRVFSARRMLAWMLDPVMPVVAGMIYLVFTVIALSTPAVRDVETILPDYEQLAKASTEGGEGAQP